MSTLHINPTLTDGMVQKSVAYCAEKNFNGNTKRTIRALTQGRCTVCGTMTESLVKQIGEYLGQMDRTIKAVYKLEPEQRAKTSQPEDVTIQKTGINLIIWVTRKSAALDALGATLNTALAESRRKIGCEIATPACYTLDMHAVDDVDVHNRRGYGVLVNNLPFISTEVWPCSETEDQAAPE